MLIVEIVGRLKFDGKRMDIPTKRELSKEIGRVIKSLPELGIKIEADLQVLIVDPDFVSKPAVVMARIKGLIRDWPPTLRNQLAYGVAKVIEDHCPEVIAHCFIDQHVPMVTYQTVGEQGDVLVHSLGLNNLARCGFSSRTPEVWPNNHRGVTVAEDVTCPACLACRIPQAV